MADNKIPVGDQDMGVEGIGASVVRKEDKRFITGKGRYVDDIKLVGMTYAHFIRSPHAHHSDEVHFERKFAHDGRPRLSNNRSHLLIPWS